jgi:hypothetical protein
MTEGIKVFIKSGRSKKRPSFILILLFVLIYSCGERNNIENRKDFGAFELELPQDYSVKSVSNSNNEMKWYVFHQSDSLYVVYKADTTRKWSNPSAYGFGTKDVNSLYDCYLSLNKKEIDKFHISYFEIGDAKGRIIQRTYKNTGEYLELSFKNICGLTSILQITGYSISKGTSDEMVQAAKSISFKCN